MTPLPKSVSNNCHPWVHHVRQNQQLTRQMPSCHLATLHANATVNSITMQCGFPANADNDHVVPLAKRHDFTAGDKKAAHIMMTALNTDGKPPKALPSVFGDKLSNNCQWKMVPPPKTMKMTTTTSSWTGTHLVPCSFKTKMVQQHRGKFEHDRMKSNAKSKRFHFPREEKQIAAQMEILQPTVMCMLDFRGHIWRA